MCPQCHLCRTAIRALDQLDQLRRDNGTTQAKLEALDTAQTAWHQHTLTDLTSTDCLTSLPITWRGHTTTQPAPAPAAAEPAADQPVAGQQGPGQPLEP